MSTESGSEADAEAWAAFEAWALEHGFIPVLPEDWDAEGEAGDVDVTVIGRADAEGRKDQTAT